MAGGEPALFRRFPDLLGRLAHRPFLPAATPVEPLDLEGVPQGLLFVKRDELSCPLYGGNKPRKLAFVIGRALERGARRIVTTGGLGTHHGLATTILARAAGLDTTLVLVDQPMTVEVRDSLLLFLAYGAEVRHGGNVAGAVPATLAALATATLAGERPFLVPPGGSSSRGNLGFVSAGLELGEQVQAGLLPEPAELFVAVGTGGTLAGLVVGLRLAGLATKVVGVLVTDILPPTPRRLLRAARATERLLRRHHPALPLTGIAPADFELVTTRVGAGYGAATPESAHAVHTAARSGLRLEATYTGKCLAELWERARRSQLRGPVVFWNTFNAVDVAARAPRRPALRELPRSIRRLLPGDASPPDGSRGPTR